MDRILGGDAESFTRLFERHAPTAIAVARSVLGQHHLADDAVQEAFLAVWRAPDRYRSQHASVRTWLLSIVHHRAVDCVRREETQRSRASRLSGFSLVGREERDPSEMVVADLSLFQERANARRALGDLPASQRQVIDLMYFGGLSQSQVAERLSLPLGTVKSRTRLGMGKLRAALGEIER
ncbi:MAG: sigma-70 family RNA polymerase sigma factor [Actinomycetota bacterium]